VECICDAETVTRCATCTNDREGACVEGYTLHYEKGGARTILLGTTFRAMNCAGYSPRQDADSGPKQSA